MARWSDRAEELLYDGESIERRVDAGDSAVVVTSHRVLAFTPSAEGSNFQQVDRPNVTGVSVRGRGERRFLRLGARAVIYGSLLVAAGVFLPIDTVLGDVGLPETTGQLGLGGILGLFNTMIELLRNLDDLLRLFGGLLLLFALVPLGVYAWSRDRALLIEVAGEDSDPIEVPADDIESDVVAEQIRAAVFPEGVDHDSGGRLERLLP